MSEAHILCLMCRGVFTDEQIKGHNCCPICGNKGLPGDTREMAPVVEDIGHHMAVQLARTDIETRLWKALYGDSIGTPGDDQ